MDAVFRVLGISSQDVEKRLAIKEKVKFIKVALDRIDRQDDDTLVCLLAVAMHEARAGALRVQGIIQLLAATYGLPIAAKIGDAALEEMQRAMNSETMQPLDAEQMVELLWLTVQEWTKDEQEGDEAEALLRLRLRAIVESPPIKRTTHAGQIAPPITPGDDSKIH